MGLGQFRGMGPVGGGPAPVEQPGLGEGKCAGADRDHPRPGSTGPDERVAQCQGSGRTGEPWD